MTEGREQRDEGSARTEGGREAPALGAGRALPGVAPRAGHPIGGPHWTPSRFASPKTPWFDDALWHICDTPYPSFNVGKCLKTGHAGWTRCPVMQASA